MLIKVTAAHAIGADLSGGNSPIARAIKEATKTTKDVQVWTDRVCFRENGQEVCYALPAECNRADQKWTKERVLEPFEFQLRRVPVPCYPSQQPSN